MERLQDVLLSSFFTSPQLQFSLALSHQLFIQTIQSKNEDEVPFLIGSNQPKLGVGEFILVTGLDCIAYPSEKSSNRRLWGKNFNATRVVNSQAPNDAFLECEGIENFCKLDLCYFVYGLLLASKPSTNSA